MSAERGVPCYRWGEAFLINSAREPTHVAFPEAEAEARDGMEKAVDALLACEPMSERFHDTLIVLRLTQANLECARQM